MDDVICEKNLFPKKICQIWNYIEEKTVFFYEIFFFKMKSFFFWNHNEKMAKQTANISLSSFNTIKSIKENAELNRKKFSCS